jgi:glutathione S-transferase
MTYQGRSKDSRDAWRVARADEALDIMNLHLSKQEWLVGASITAADIALIAYTRAAERGGLELESRAPLRSWIDRCELALGIGASAGMAGIAAP